MFFAKVVLFLLFVTSISEAGLFDFLKNSTIYKSYEARDYNTTKDLLLTEHEDSAVYYYDLANTYYKLGRFKEAIIYYKRAFGEGVDEHNRLHNLGNSYFQIKEYKWAIIAYTYALKLKEDADTQHNLELAKNALKKPKQQKESNREKRREKSKKDAQKKSKKEQNKARKLTQKELKALKDLKKKMQQKEEIKRILQRNLKEKRVPVIMYPINQKESDDKQPW